MGVVAVSELNKIFWAGRYCERALSVCDRYCALPSSETAQRDFFERLGLNEGSSFEDSLFEITLLDIVEAWRCNAFELRHIFGSRAISYSETAADNCKNKNYGGLIMCAHAFCGVAEDRLIDKTARCCFTAGRMSEKLDILSRFDEETYLLENALDRLLTSIDESDTVKNIIGKCGIALIKRDIECNDVSVVKAHTCFLENGREYS